MEFLKTVSIIIPSLSPDEKLLSLLADLREAGFEHIVVVNDGSTAEYAPYFQKAREQFGCTVLTHAVNQGKGRALKTAFHYLLAECPDCQAAVSVDSDGQHRINDIRQVARETVEHPDSLIMGCRDFSSANENIPARSRFGNVTTSRVLRLLCGIHLSDTQTGLRGFSPAAMRLFLSTKGERFEYEMNMILDAKENDMPLREVPIETVYIEENRTSHFNPLKDSLRIYAVFSKFILSSAASFAIDICLFTLFSWLFTDLGIKKETAIVVAAYGARALSALCNYTINRNRVFHTKTDGTGSIVRYALLCVAQITLSAAATAGLYGLLRWNETLLKFLVDVFLFIISFQIQRNWVFRKQ